MAHGNIPQNCDKILFAEDVVSHILFRTLQVHYEPKVATPYREFIYEGFDESVKASLNDICQRVGEYNRLFDVGYVPLNRKQFHRFAMFMLKRYFTEGFDPKYFLIYSVHLSLAASKMVNIIGLQSAGDLAVKYLLKGFRNRDMFTGGWDVLHIMAMKYANRRDFMDDLTPDIEMMLPQNVVGDDDNALSDEDFEEENEPQNAEVANVLDDDNNDRISEQKLDDSGRHFDQKIEDGENSCNKNLDVGESRKESENSEIKICLEEMKDVVEKNVTPDVIQSTSAVANEASVEHVKCSGFLESTLSETEKRNLPSFFKLNQCLTPDKKENKCGVNTKHLSEASALKKRSPKRDHKGREINQIINVSSIPPVTHFCSCCLVKSESATSSFSSSSLEESESKSDEGLMLRENESNTSKRSKTFCEDTSNQDE